jgi:hypothetical protein
MILALDLSPDGRTVAAGGTDGAVTLWDVATGQPVRRLTVLDDPNEPDHQRAGSVRSVRFTPDGRSLAAVVKPWELGRGSTGIAGAFWELSSGRVTVSAEQPHSDFFVPNDYPLSGDGRLFVRIDSELTIHVLRTADAREVATIPTRRKEDSRSYTPEVALSPDSRQLAAAVRPPVEGTRAVDLWLRDPATGREIARWPAVGMVWALAFSPDGRLLAVGESDGLRVWELATRREVLRHPAEGVVGCVSFAPDGRTLVAGLHTAPVVVWEALPRPAGDRSPEACWSALADPDPAVGYAAVATLFGQPEAAVSLLTARLRPAEGVDRERLRRLVADLQDDRYSTRQAAMKELEGLGGLAESELRLALTGHPGIEARRRVEALLAGLRGPPPPDLLRALRAVAVLERINTPAARGLLAALTKGAPGALLTQEATAALGRLTVQ